jgi:hypothetical protein
MEPVKIILTFLSLLLFAAAIVLGYISRKHRVPGAPPMPTFNPAHWFQPWKLPDRYTPKGMKLFFTSYVCMMAGLALYIFSHGFVSPF